MSVSLALITNEKCIKFKNECQVKYYQPEISLHTDFQLNREMFCALLFEWVSIGIIAKTTFPMGGFCQAFWTCSNYVDIDVASQKMQKNIFCHNLNIWP